MKKKSLVFVYVFSFYVQLSSAIDQVLLLEQVSARIDALLCCGLQKPRKRQDQMAGKGEKVRPVIQQWQRSSAGVIRGNVSGKTVL